MVLTQKQIKLSICTILVVGIGCIGSVLHRPVPWTSGTSLQEVKQSIGIPAPKHQQQSVKTIDVQRGKDLILYGRTIGPDGKKTNYISKHFKCTHCHNIVPEDPNLGSRDPEARLTYAIENDIPFLQGTTFHGIVNRTSWYNDDYVKKYGDMVKAANESLREAIQLCAIECAQGRELESWEIEAILAYFWTLEVKLGDLDLSPVEYAMLNQLRYDPQNSAQLQELLSEKFLTKSPATFVSAPDDKVQGYPYKGDTDRGRAIYRLSCMHCHQEGEVSGYPLDYSTLTFRHLKNKIPQDSHFSLYQIIRYGTYAIPGHSPYMPHYPIERMSHQQVEDLRAYIELMAF